MRFSHVSKITTVLVVAGLFLCGADLAKSCPFCSAPQLTLSQQMDQADAVVLVAWVDGKAANLQFPGSTEFEVVEVVQQPEGGKLAKGNKIILERFRSAKAGDEFMLFGTKVPDSIEWSGSPLEVSKLAYEYIRNSPKPSLPKTDRLNYFVKYLETNDKFIADDAFGEFANAEYSDVAKVSDVLPRDRLRTWLTSKDVVPGRMGLYGMMLGLCGQPEDAELMASKIFEKSDDFRLGIDGIMGGYLLLTGEKGLVQLEDQKLKNKKAAFSETYAAMQAVRFMWQYGDGRISQDRLRETMRILLDRPELADLVIADLSRMKDWSVQDKLRELYDDETNIPSVKRAIVRYFLTSAADTGKKNSNSPSVTPAVDPSEADGKELPAHAIKGLKYLAEIEKKDPRTVNEAKRFFLIK